MSGDEAVKALREWCELKRDKPIVAKEAIVVLGIADDDLRRGLRALLAAAPALLARIEAGEGLLREAREWLASMSMQQGRPSKVLLKDIDAIAVFLAAKEADRG